LSRLRRSLKRIDMRGRRIETVPADRAWRSMLERLDNVERERRLRAAEAALNSLNS
jgi:hypothetical protein